MGKADLRVDWATHAAAKYACENWHYSKCLPVGKVVRVGAWVSGKFIGVVMFARGANCNGRDALKKGREAYDTERAVSIC